MVFRKFIREGLASAGSFFYGENLGEKFCYPKEPKRNSMKLPKTESADEKGVLGLRGSLWNYMETFWGLQVRVLSGAPKCPSHRVKSVVFYFYGYAYGESLGKSLGEMKTPAKVGGLMETMAFKE